MAYNGWTNYETWNVSLWLDNDEGTYYQVREMLTEWSESGDDIYVLTDTLREYVEELAEMVCPGVISGASFVADMFGAALSEVNWHEISENLRSELPDEVANV